MAGVTSASAPKGGWREAGGVGGLEEEEAPRWNSPSSFSFKPPSHVSPTRPLDTGMHLHTPIPQTNTREPPAPRLVPFHGAGVLMSLTQPGSYHQARRKGA